MILFDNLPIDLHNEYALAYEARTIHDTATLQIRDYHSSKGPTWVVSVIKPDKSSGSATVPGAYIEGDTGRFVTPEKNSAVVVKKGFWQVSAAADPLARKTGSYAWTEPLEKISRVPIPEDLYSPFSYGGTIIYRPNLSASGIEQFGACRMIFPEWVGGLAAAFASAPHLEQLSDQTAGQPAAVAELERIAAGDNGALATIAFRNLLQSSASAESRTLNLFKSTDMRKISTFVYLNLVVRVANDPAGRTAQVRKLLNETKDTDRLLAIAYAAFAVSLFATQDSSAVDAAREILSQLHKRVKELGIPVTQNSTWFLIFKKMGVFESG